MQLPHLDRALAETAPATKATETYTTVASRLARILEAVREDADQLRPMIGGIGVWALRALLGWVIGRILPG